MTQSTTVTHITPAERNAARATDPTAYLRAHGFTVKRIGRNMSVSRNGEELYRITCLADGHYVWTDHYGSTGGDNIDLVRAIEPSTSFIEAACKLLGKATVFATKHSASDGFVWVKFEDGSVESILAESFVLNRIIEA